MKSWTKASICIGLSLMFCFMSIGYAALTDDLSIWGTAKVDIPSGLFIIDISEGTASNLDKHQAEYLEYTTTIDATQSRTNSGNRTGSVTYTVTVLNNTKLSYSYRDIYFQTNLSEYNGNATYQEGWGNNRKTYSYINNEGTSNKRIDVDTYFPNGKIVQPGKKLTFEVTYTVGTGMDARTDWRTLINFQFGINVDGEEKALEIVEEKFLNILNTTSTYNELFDVLDNKFDGRDWTSNYIGNVKDSTSADSAALNTLFAGHLQITVGNQEMDATVLIKHENIDGNENTGDDYTAYYGNQSYSGYGCEMTLYLTVDPLTASGHYVPVYAVVFTCEKGADGKPAGDWYRIGDTYYGEADVVAYNGDTGTGSFVTDRWNTRTSTYNVVDGYSYNISGTQYNFSGYSYSIGEDRPIEEVLMAYDTNANAALQTLLNHAKSIIDSKEYAGTGINLVEKAYFELSAYYELDANGNPIVNADISRAKLCPPIKDLYHAVNEALVRMEALSKQPQ